jgi:Inner membrane protein YgaP-like, transmembrane domain
VQKTTMSFPMTRQGVRNLDAVRGPVLPYSGGPAKQRTNVGSNERMLSALGGGALAAYGLTRGTGLGLGLALVGAALLYRGMTGHCDVYQALGRSTATHDNTREVAYRAG